MAPSNKEKQCIEFSNNLKQLNLEREISKLKETKPSIFKTPTEFIKEYSIPSKNIALWKIIILYVIATIFYLIQIPLLLLAGLYNMITHKKRLNSSIDQLKSKYRLALDYEVSEIKLFSQLWHDKGLTNNSIYKPEEQRQCIYEWFKILYGETTRLDSLYNVIQSKQNQGASEFKKENPKGHVSMAPPEALLPEDIDKHFGKYIP